MKQYKLYYNSRFVKSFNSIDEIIIYRILILNLDNMLRENCSVSFDKYKKDVKFISWDYANKNMNNKYDNFVYTFKKQIDIGAGGNYNGDWEYIPIMSCYDNGTRLNIWAEVDYSQKILI